MISAEELRLEIRESDDSLHNIFLNHGLSLETAFKLLEKRKGQNIAAIFGRTERMQRQNQLKIVSNCSRSSGVIPE